MEEKRYELNKELAQMLKRWGNYGRYNTGAG